LEVRAALRVRARGIYQLADGEYLNKKAIAGGMHIMTATVDRLHKAGRVKAELLPMRHGRASHRRVYRKEDLLDYTVSRGKKFDGVYQIPEKGRGLNLTRAWAQYGFAQSFLKDQLKRSTYLPEGKLPSVRMMPPRERGRARLEHVVLEADLERLRVAVGNARHNGAGQLPPCPPAPPAPRPAPATQQPVAAATPSRGRRGRKQDPDVGELLAACHHAYLSFLRGERTLKVAASDVRAEFPDKKTAPQHGRTLRLYARRYAARHGLPWPPRP
jgi:hypothetical protein